MAIPSTRERLTNFQTELANCQLDPLANLGKIEQIQTQVSRFRLTAENRPLAKQVAETAKDLLAQAAAMQLRIKAPNNDMGTIPPVQIFSGEIEDLFTAIGFAQGDPQKLGQLKETALKHKQAATSMFQADALQDAINQIDHLTHFALQREFNNPTPAPRPVALPRAPIPAAKAPQRPFGIPVIRGELSQFSVRDCAGNPLGTSACVSHAFTGASRLYRAFKEGALIDGKLLDAIVREGAANHLRAFENLLQKDISLLEIQFQAWVTKDGGKEKREHQQRYSQKLEQLHKTNGDGLNLAIDEVIRAETFPQIVLGEEYQRCTNKKDVIETYDRLFLRQLRAIALRDGFAMAIMTRAPEGSSFIARRLDNGEVEFHHFDTHQDASSDPVIQKVYLRSGNLQEIFEYLQRRYTFADYFPSSLSFDPMTGQQNTNAREFQFFSIRDS